MLCPMEIYMDNSMAIKNIQTRNVTGLSKAVRGQFHYVQDQYKRGYINVNWQAGTDNTADIFTKPLPVSTFNKFQLRLVEHE